MAAGEKHRRVYHRRVRHPVRPRHEEEYHHEY
jgi:hypothetical protein